MPMRKRDGEGTHSSVNDVNTSKMTHDVATSYKPLQEKYLMQISYYHCYIYITQVGPMDQSSGY